MDNVWATLHTALFIAYLEEQESWIKVDTLYLMKKILFTSFADLILSDINSGTKGYIKKLDNKIFDELYEKAYSHFLKNEAPEVLRKDFDSVLHEKNKKLEDYIFVSAKKYVGYFECKTNEKVFSEMYEVPLKELKEALQIWAQELKSLKKLLENPNYEKYLAHIYRLSFSMRWNQYHRTAPISVMSHKVVVVYLSYIIAMIWNDAWEGHDTLEMMLRAIYHDVPEVITWDIITPTKKAIPGFEELLESVEETMMDDYLFWYISTEYQAYLNPYILHPFEWEVWVKVKYADIFSALIEAKVEDQAGNHFFHEKYQAILSHISRIKHPGVEFLLKEILFHFDSTSDDSIRPTYS